MQFSAFSSRRLPEEPKYTAVAVGADVDGRVGHDLFPDRVDRGVRHLGEKLLEVAEQRLPGLRQYGKRDVGTHGGNGLRAGFRHRQDGVLYILIGVTKGLVQLIPQLLAVLLDSDFLMPPMRSRYDLVGVDNLGVGWTLGRHLADAGARRIAYFTNPHPAPSSLNRGNGLATAVVDAGLKWSRDSVIIGDPRDKDLVKRLVTGRNRVDAFIAVNDWIAGILERTLLSIGVKIPDDVMLAGVNGDAESESAAIPITTVRQPCHEIGMAAVTLMAMRMSDIAAPAREVKLAAEMIVRQSTTRAGHPGLGSRK